MLIRSTGEIERLDCGGIPIGLFAHVRFTAGKVQMGPGSRLVIFTDGLSEAQNAAQEEFGDQRLIDYCKTIAAGANAREVADGLMQAVADFSVGTEQFDDTTVVVIDVAS